MAWTLRFNDEFAEASDTFLSSHAPDTGVSWTYYAGASDSGKVYAADDTLGCAFSSNGNRRIYTADISGTWAAKQKAEALNARASNRRLAVRIGGTDRGYNAYHNGGDNTLRVYRADSTSSQTLLLSDFDNTVDSADVIGLIADGLSISIELNGVATASSPVTDATYSDGSPGVMLSPTVTSAGMDSYNAYDEAAAGGVHIPVAMTGGIFEMTGGLRG